jgi:energy-coupling factor transport system ATP-binding protein
MHHGKCILDNKPSEVFKEIDTLESVGLAVPQVTYVIKKLRQQGFNISEDIFTIKQAKDALLEYFKG